MASVLVNKFSKVNQIKSVLITQICSMGKKPKHKDLFCFPNRDPNYIRKGIYIFEHENFIIILNPL
jgi:hypothetical protein